ncbi:4-hydroxy-3-methylbut-2-enyl diphosphate reductase [Desulfolutivibrio sulfoxidireducens]|uniref:4-hydroxy-3-methylbut-2-enyl diphosphate reductase n=1 Tax=Desulfolutivibrio sulfoxidireducens TaxID=2773299 RepID=UPI00159CFCC7|nr:4-hydroxy-3-methylbut-2-enyl diphosphate reductase [Desulfolutivibrio sulfoxidireducens]QLA20324.1 4-hydroxy-3-methylbut-2-enyl diphosphate reductase [Desulfolutivibrio sulfoxidireducens]
MEILRAETAGFCMGVDLALRKLEAILREADQHGPIHTLGPIIHNPQVMAEYAERGVLRTDDPEDVAPGSTVVIRAHGVPRSVRESLATRGVRVMDATCPRVRTAQRLIAKQAEKGRILLLFGEQDHPEVKGLLSHASAGAFVFDSPERLKEMDLPAGPEFFLAAQTTQDREEFTIIQDLLKNRLDRDFPVLSTICDATMKRQQEAIELAGLVDYMVVVGGFESGNTRRLAQVARSAGASCVHVETADQLPLNELRAFGRIGLTAGASTPKKIIDRVHSVLASL